MELEWLTNTYDPSALDAPRKIDTREGETQQEAWQEQKRWLADKIIGPPQATAYFTVTQLYQQHMRGVYRKKV